MNLLNIFSKLLTHEGFQVIGTAHDGESAIIKHDSLIRKPDIILLDHRMPLKDGLTTAKELLANNSEAQIIMISSDFRVKKMALLNGVKKFLLKPFSIKKLVEEIKELSLETILTI